MGKRSDWSAKRLCVCAEGEQAECGSACTREIRKVRFVANFQYIPKVLTPIYPYHQNGKAPKIISIICQNQIVS